MSGLLPLLIWQLSVKGKTLPSAVITNAGLLANLNDRLKGRLFVRVYRNDVPVLPDSFLGDFDPALFPGYSDVEVTSLWPPAILDMFGRALSRINLQFTRGAGGVPEWVYGWVMYELPSPDSYLVAGRKFDVPQRTAFAGDKIKFQISYYALKG